MPVLHDAPGRYRWITIHEENATRFLLLDGCEEGAMALNAEDPVFNYLWFHKCSALGRRPVNRALVLGAGAFTAAKCLALDYPNADVDAVDEEPDLEAIARRYFRLDRPAFVRIRFHGRPAETFLAESHPPYDFIFDDLFDGFQHVPVVGRGIEHVGRLRAALAEGGVCLKNLIWSPLGADTRAACADVTEAWQAHFAHHGILALGEPSRGHNRLLLGWTTGQKLDETAVRLRLAVAGVPPTMLEQCHWL